MADFFGIVALACILAIIRLAVIFWNISYLAMLVIFSVFAIAALFLWHSERWPITINECLKLAAVTTAIGAGFFVIDLVLGSMFHPDLPPLEAATHAGGMFGFYFTLMICPGITVVALAGAVRALAAKRSKHESGAP